MSQFFKFLFASCLGTMVAIGVIVLFFFSFAAIMGSKDSSIPANSVLLLDFDSPIPEKSDNVKGSSFGYTQTSFVGLRQLQRLIEHAKSDDHIKGIVLKPSWNSTGFATAQSIRNSILDFREGSDKFVYTYADYYSNASYHMATATDSIYLNPNGSLYMKGYGAMIPFFKDVMEKVGIEMNIFYAGNYKSATEPFRRMDMSPENKAQTREYLNEMYNFLVEDIVAQRDVSKDALNDFISDYDYQNVDDALELGLVDRSLHWYEFEDMVRDQLGIKKGREISYVKIEEYNRKSAIKSKRSAKNKIAVVYAEGEIMYDSKDKGVVTEKKYHKIFDKIRKDKKVKAIVLRVNSPGGSAYSSEVLLREFETLNESGIPFVASFGDLAASGGYYIAAGADTIVASPKSLTGSIGVYSMFPNFSNLLEDKLGIAFDTVKTNPSSISLTSIYDLNQAEMDVMEKYTDDMYEKFLSRVAEGRGMTMDEVHEVGQGRVWTGRKAQELGLVDVLGDLDDAIGIAANMAGIEEYRLVEYPYIKKEIWEELLTSIMEEEMANAEMRLSDVEKDLFDTYSEIRRFLQYREPMARLPFILVH